MEKKNMTDNLIATQLAFNTVLGIPEWGIVKYETRHRGI